MYLELMLIVIREFARVEAGEAQCLSSDAKMVTCNASLVLKAAH